MRRQEERARRELAALAGDEKGRHLLQLALRGIQDSGRGLTYGCWVKSDGGVSGCLFQHAYWQGLEEGVFVQAEQPGGEIREYVGDEDFAVVMEAIRAFDAMGRSSFRRWQPGPLGLPWPQLDEERWRSGVETLLIEALASAPDANAPEPAGVPA